MEMGIAIFLGAFLIGIGVLAYCRIRKDFKEGNKKNEYLFHGYDPFYDCLYSIGIGNQQTG